jgi:fluoroacetyl-CoA thioesterase
MTMTNLSPGASTSLTLRVVDSMLASALAERADERYPAMFATPFMIAAMERACADLLTPLLGAGDLSVGARIEVAHVAPTPAGASVTVTAIFSSFEAPLYWFDVKASDQGGTIGKGRIARAIVHEADLVAKAAARTGQVGS